MNSSLRESIGMEPWWIKSPAMAAAHAISWVPGSGFINPDYRWRFAEVLNPMYLMADHRFDNYNKNKNLALIDAGIAFNLPFPPLNDYEGKRLERKPDVIIFIDASADYDNVTQVNEYGQKTKQAWANGDALIAVADYARFNKVAFPDLPSKHKLSSATCSIISKQYMHTQQEPVVIYLPVTKDITELNAADVISQVRNDNKVDGYIPIDPKQIELSNYPTVSTGLDVQSAVDLMALMEYNVLFHETEIKKAICDRAHQAKGVNPAH